jgi:mRNA-degrading endonuclease RelE of RelBE toxin-antitoxin system
MIYRQSSDFKKAYNALPARVKKKAVKQFELFKANPRHPSLGVKKIQGHPNYWEGRIDRSYRFTFEYLDDPESGESICVFRNIGRHDIVKTSP